MAEAIVPVKRTRTWLFVLGGLLLLIAVAGMAAVLLIHNKQLANFEAYSYAGAQPAAEAPASGAGPAGAPSSNAGKHVFTALDMFTANLAERDQDRFAQVGVVVELADAKAGSAFNAVVPPVRSEILLLLSSKTADDLLSLKGKQLLAEQIVEIVRKYIAPEFRQSVFGAHFSSFVIQ
ncbi:MAG: flagellar basal body-associated FliL family protein [Pigmentiphaga sp.]|uniref:flagellar basal body-associated FliL family protein n=1 Tax=Pigmentiphaga sp. TaxID=1977564 RepID=UPI0029A993F0|nr:flagellar basal body-associated FliL family protein [Pigmentiphaga sp.]MDX3904145.1 flagellar basal body-associated FliL family protein [Pigmentiphaga sp.]